MVETLLHGRSPLKPCISARGRAWLAQFEGLVLLPGVDDVNSPDISWSYSKFTTVPPCLTRAQDQQ